MGPLTVVTTDGVEIEPADHVGLLNDMNEQRFVVVEGGIAYPYSLARMRTAFVNAIYAGEQEAGQMYAADDEDTLHRVSIVSLGEQRSDSREYRIGRVAVVGDVGGSVRYFGTFTYSIDERA